VADPPHDGASSTVTASPSKIERAQHAADARGDLVPGTWIDRYEVIELLGQGS
jgi:hypothetical protein